MRPAHNGPGRLRARGDSTAGRGLTATTWTGTGRFHLDPARLDDRATGWTLHREPGAGGSSARYTIRRRGAPAPRFTLQRLEKHPEPAGGDHWVDVAATLSGLQAGGRLRPKPWSAGPKPRSSCKIVPGRRRA